MKLEELYQDFISSSKESREHLAHVSANELFGFLCDHEGNEQGVADFVSILAVFVKSDGKSGAEEYESFARIIDAGVSYAQFRDLMEMEQYPVALARAKEVYQSAPEEIKKDILSLGLLICVSDEEMTRSEKNIFEAFLAL
jgi:hypothetical protein